VNVFPQVAHSKEPGNLATHMHIKPANREESGVKGQESDNWGWDFPHTGHFKLSGKRSPHSQAQPICFAGLPIVNGEGICE